MLAFVPASLLFPVVFLFGAVVGSFLNVVIYRFHTGRSLSGRSHCLSCGTSLRWYELIPLLSYVALRGRCRTCGSYIPPRYFLVELLTALLFMAAAVTFTDVVLVLASFILFSLLIIIVVYDYYHFIIPDQLVLLVTLIAFLGEVYRYFMSGSLQLVGYDLLAALGVGAFFFFLWYVSGGRWLGFGDVKLAPPLALLAGGTLAFSFVVWSFWIGAAISLGILFMQWLLKRGQSRLRFGSRTLKMKSEVPFGPFLVAGFLVVYLFGLDVLTLMFHAI